MNFDFNITTSHVMVAIAWVAFCLFLWFSIPWLWEKWGREKVSKYQKRMKRPLKESYLDFVVRISIIILLMFIFLFIRAFTIELDSYELDKNKIRFTIQGSLVVLFALTALFGFYLAMQIYETKSDILGIRRRDLIPDEIKKATEALVKNNKDGTPAIEARVKALNELGKIGRDNIQYHIQIMKIACAYIRINSPVNSKIDTDKELRKDIREAISIIRFRGWGGDGIDHIEYEKEQGYCVDLSHCDLHGTSLGNDLRHVNFNGADLSDIHIILTDITGAKFDGANMANVWLCKSYAREGDFSKCKNLTQGQLKWIFCKKSVKIPKNLKYPEHWIDDNPYWDDFEERYEAWQREFGLPDVYPRSYPND